MLKKVSVILFATLLFACVSEPTDKRFKGAGDFDTAEAAKTRVSLGLTYLKNGNFSQAKFNLDKALEFAPRSGEANFAMAFYYQQVDEIARAHEYYKQAINFSNDDPDILNSYGAFLCGQGDYSQAKKYFLQSVDDKSYISAASTYENLAICSQSQGLIDEAITYFTSALNHQPTRASSLFYLSQLYIEKGRWDEAKKSLWKYERNASVNAESLWLSFQIARGQQDLRASVEYAEILKRMYPNNPNTQKAVNELGKFQPDMTVTQKRRENTEKVQSSNEVAAVNQPTPQQAIVNTKSSRVLKPVEKTTLELEVTAPGTESEKLDAPSSDAELDRDTELALKNALDNAGAALVNVDESTNNVSDADTDTSENTVELVDEISAEVSAKDAQDDVSQNTGQIAVAETVEIINNSAEQTIDTNKTDVSTAVDGTANALAGSGTPFHVVKPKENLYRISLKYNVKINKLLEWNGLADASSIRIGTKLWVGDPNLNE